MLQVKKGKEESLIESLLTSPLANSLVAPANSLSGGLIRALKQSSFPIINIGRNFKRLIRGFMEIPCVIKLSLQKEWNSLEIVDELSNLVICG
jgi:predicted deacetylase